MLELSVCPRCGSGYPDYHAIDEGGFLCDWCGYWSQDPEPHDCPAGCAGHMGPRQMREFLRSHPL